MLNSDTIVKISSKSAFLYSFSITGLDPAGPLFTKVDTKYRLDPSDALYVDVVHTDALNIGTVEKVGHTDFWANGGFTQPGCIKNNLFRKYISTDGINTFRRFMKYYF